MNGRVIYEATFSMPPREAIKAGARFLWEGLMALLKGHSAIDLNLRIHDEED